MSVKKGANCQDAPRLFTYSHVAFSPKNGLVHQTSMTETACLQHHFPPLANALSSSNIFLSFLSNATGHFELRERFLLQ